MLQKLILAGVVMVAAIFQSYPALAEIGSGLKGIAGHAGGKYDADNAKEPLEPLYLGVNHEALFEAVGYVGGERRLSTSGVYFPFVKISRGGREVEFISHLALAVHKSVEHARVSFRQFQSQFAIGPVESGKIGETKFLCWSRGPEGGTVSLRSKNMTLVFGFTGSATYAKKMVNIIARCVEDDREVTRLGVFSVEPEIVNRGALELSATDENGVRSVRPEIRGMGPEEQLLLMPLNVGYLGRGEDESTMGQLRLLLPNSGEERKIEVIAVNEENMVVSGVVSIAAFDEP